MKIIDLLNKIAKGEEPPQTIVHNCDVYNYNCNNNMAYMYTCDDGTNLFQMSDSLNEEVQILEEVEDKEYEDIEELTYENTFKDNSDMEVQEILVNKINALIRNQKKILERLDK